MNVTVWDECQPGLQEHYPNGIHAVIDEGLRTRLGDQVAVRVATLDQPFHGLPAEVLESTDVLLWWGHLRHDEVDDKVVDEVQRRVLAGMGLLVLHSGQGSKIFRRLMGTTCAMAWRHDDRELVWTIDPAARCFAAGAAFAGAGGGSSTSARGMRNSRSTVNRRSN